jgi:MFS transporter, DHA1 family, multidrug resistance protein
LTRLSRAGLGVNRQIAALFLCLFVNMVGFGIIIPIMPFYVQSLGASSFELGALMATYSLMQFISAPLWGRYSDRVGRRRVMMIGTIGFSVTFAAFALSTQLWMLFVTRILGGILGSAMLPTAMAYIGDSTSVKDRGGSMSLLGAAMGMGMIFGPAIGGYLGSISATAPFWVAAALGVITCVLTYFVLPESLPIEKRVAHAAGAGRSSLIGALRGPLGITFVLALLVSFGAANLESMFPLFAEYKLGYGSAEVGTVFTVVGILSVALQFLVVGRAINRFGEVRLTRLGMLVAAVGYVLVTQAFDLWSLILFVAVQNLGLVFVGPALSSYVSKRTAYGQGTAMGLQQSFNSLGRVMGPLWGGAVFGYSYYAPYATAAIVMILGTVGSILLLDGTKIHIGAAEGAPALALKED